MKESVLIGGGIIDYITEIEFFSNGDILLLGGTTSNDFPVTSDAFSSTLSDDSYLLLIKLRTEPKTISFGTIDFITISVTFLGFFQLLKRKYSKKI